MSPFDEIRLQREELRRAQVFRLRELLSASAEGEEIDIEETDILLTDLGVALDQAETLLSLTRAVLRAEAEQVEAEESLDGLREKMVAAREAYSAKRDAYEREHGDPLSNCHPSGDLVPAARKIVQEQRAVEVLGEVVFKAQERAAGADVDRASEKLQAALQAAGLEEPEQPAEASATRSASASRSGGPATDEILRMLAMRRERAKS
jgi:hypothetical protein